MQPVSIKRIVVGMDFSRSADAAMAQAFSLAARFDVPVDLVHVLEPGALTAPATLGAMALGDGKAIFEGIDRELTSRAQQAAAAGVICQTESLQGSPSRELVRHAEKTGADLIVVGTHGRTGLPHILLGSVAQKVVQRASCSVLVVPTRDRPRPRE